MEAASSQKHLTDFMVVTSSLFYIAVPYNRLLTADSSSHQGSSDFDDDNSYSIFVTWR